MNLDDKFHEWNMKGREIRARIFKPILEFLNRAKIKPNTIGNFRAGLAIVFVFLFGDYPILATILYLFALILDIFDGALARYQKISSDRGKFLDIFVDSFVYMCMIFVLFPMIDELLLGYNIFIISAVYLLAVIFKNEGKPTDWIIKPYPRLSYLKTIVVVPFFAFVFFQIDVTHEALWICNVWASLLAVYYFFGLQKKWKI